MANRNISQIHDFIDVLFRKSRGVFIPAADKDAVLDAAQKELFKECYNTKEFDAIRPFKMNNVPIDTNSNGLLNYPSDFEYLVGAFVDTLAAPIEIRGVNESELPKAMKSQLRKVTTAKPIMVDGGRVAQIYPLAVYAVKLTYYRTPSAPRYSFSTSGRVITYNAGSSIQLEVSDIFIDRIIAKALSYLGLSMSEQEVIQFAQQKEVSA